MKRTEDISFEESLSDNWAKDLGIREVPLANRVLSTSGIVVTLISLVVSGRVLMLAGQGRFYSERANNNLMVREEVQAPRGLMYDRAGVPLAENEQSFFVFLEIKKFFEDSGAEEKVVSALHDIIGIEPSDFWARIASAGLEERGSKILVTDDVTQSQLIQLKSLNLPFISFGEGFRRIYPKGHIFSSVIGYTGLVNADDLTRDPSLGRQAAIGRTGIEAFHDAELRGEPGAVITLRDAHGDFMSDPEFKEPAAGGVLRLTIDAEFQEYFFERFKERFRELGRSAGVGLALDPRSGDVLALMSFPNFDNNAFVLSGRSEERSAVLHASGKPLFNRAIGGFYTPGSTIKPLVALAALVEGVATPEYEVFSPGYLDVPNPFRPDEPTRFLDWRYHGVVNLKTAIAQSSNVYFYAVGGGTEGHEGLGINRLREWWERFHLGKPTGIDLANEASGFLPSSEHKKKETGEPWRLGDTYNVSIGQGDLLVTPIQLLAYIGTLGNGGKMMKPRLVLDGGKPELLADLSRFSKELDEVAKGMAAAVTSPEGTARLLSDLPFRVAAKTGTAQVQNKAQENAFFTGYASLSHKEKPEIAILILIENSHEGSLNTLPIAKDVLNWYYWNRMKS